MQTQDIIEDRYPLSSMQQGMLFHALYDPHAGVYIEQFIFDIPDEDLNLPAFRRAWERVIARHPGLRTSFHWEGLDAPRQYVHGRVDLPFDVEDWRGLSSSSQNDRLEAYLRADRERGFTLTQPPLTRLAVFRIGPTHSKCVWTTHHLLADGRSAVLILREVCALYDAFSRGSDVPSPPAPSFREHIDWLARQDQQQAETFWRKTLQGFTAPTPLGTRRPASGTFDGQLGEQEIRLADGATNALQALAERHLLSLSTFVQAAWALLLSRYSGEKDVVFGAVRAGRRTKPNGTEAAVGLFMNTVPVRIRVPSEMFLIPWLKELRLQQVPVAKYEHSPLVDVQRWSEVPHSVPLFESLVDFADYSPTAVIREAGSRWKNSTIEVREKTNYPLTLYAVAEPDLMLRIAYDPRRFDDDGVARMLGHLQTMLEGVAANPDRRIEDLPFLTESETRQIVVEWNQTGVDYDRHGCLHQLFEAQVARTPDKPALCFRNRQLTYRELNARANQFAQYLLKAGVRPRARVGISMERSLDMMVGLLGILKAGAVYVPLDPSYPKERLVFILDDAGIEALVTEEDLVDRFVGHRATTICVDTAWPTIAQESAASLDVRISSDDLAYLMYTSGSTGKPKGVMVRHRNVVNFFAGMDGKLDGDRDGVWLAVTSISFDISVLELFWPLTRGFTVVLHSGEEIVGSSSDSVPAPRPIEFSLFYFASSEDGAPNNKYRLLLEGAKFADTHGFSAVWTPERHFHHFGGLYPNPSVTSAAVAAVTERIQIRAGSVVLPLQNPIRVAEEWSVVDNISGGRVGISFASGWHADDFALAPGNYADRKAITFREIETVRRLWRGEPHSVKSGSGRDIQVVIHPQPIQSELPVWVTAAGEPETFRMAGEIGANLLTHLLGHSVEALAEKIAIYRKAWHDHGHASRLGREGHITLMIHTFVGQNIDAVRETVHGPLLNYLKTSSDLVRKLASTMNGTRGLDELSESELNTLHEHAFERFFQTSGLLGTPETCLEMIERLRAIGVDEVACLIDFGVEVETVMASLALLNRVREQSQEAPAERDLSIPAQISTYGVTHLQCTPSMARMLAVRAESLRALKPLRQLLLGGEALPDSLADQLSEVAPGRILNMYGPTETTVWSTTAPVQAGQRPVPIGRPIANTQTYVLDECRHPVPIGVPGELYIGGDGVAAGYHNRPELTAEKFVDDPFCREPGRCLYRTGDVARYRPDGDIEYLGRVDHQVKIRGHRIELGEIEAVLHQYPGVREAVVVAREDQPGDRRLVGYVVSATNEEVTASELRGYLKAKLAKEMVPAAFVMLRSLPRTPNGKLNRQALPAPDQVRADSERTFVAPHDAVETQLTAIWERILGVRPIGVRDNFFELGGHSLLAVNLFGQIEKTFGKSLPLAKLFEAPTIAGLAEILRRDGWGPSGSSVVPIRTGGARNPFFLVHAGHGHVLLYRQLAEHLGPDQPVYGLQSEALSGNGRLSATIEAMAATYVRDMMSAQPHGPYIVGGYCLGGLIAFEIAQQLTALGKAVESVVLLDTYNPSAVPRATGLVCTPLHWFQNLYFHVVNSVSIRGTDREKFLREKIDIAVTRLDIRARAAGSTLKRLGGSQTPHRARPVAVKRVNDRAASRYVPKPYSGRVVLIRPRGYFVGFTNPSFGWSDIVRGALVVRELPVYPKGMLIEPFCRVLADTIRSETGQAGSLRENPAVAAMRGRISAEPPDQVSGPPRPPASDLMDTPSQSEPLPTAPAL